MKYIEVEKIDKNDYLSYLNDKDSYKKIKFLLFLCEKGAPEDYEMALNALEKFHSSKVVMLRKLCIHMLPCVAIHYKRLNLVLSIKILNRGFFDKNKEVLSDAFRAAGELLEMFKEHKDWMLQNLDKDFLKNYEKLYPKKKKKSKKAGAKKVEGLCCEKIEYSINNNKIIEYDNLMRDYAINVSKQSCMTINFCPWCGVDLPKPLNEEYFKFLRKDYNIRCEDADLTNFTNIPEEFQTDEWWKKRGL